MGCSGSGKSHLARRLSERFGVPHIELDALQHQPGWQESPVEQFRAELREAVGAPGWVVDGNYRSRAADLIDADTVVWLDYSRSLVLARVVRRTVGRLVLRRELWNGNRESWRNVVSRDPLKNVVLWAWTQHPRYRATLGELCEADWVRLTSPGETQRWFKAL